MVDGKEEGAGATKVVGNTKSMLNTKDVPAPMFVTKEYLQSHYGSMGPGDKFLGPQLESHKYGWRSKKPLEPPQLRENFGRINAR